MDESLAARARRMGTPLVDESGATFVWLEEGAGARGDRLAEVLVELGWDVTDRRQHGGHNEISWAEAPVDALPAMFPPARA